MRTILLIVTLFCTGCASPHVKGKGAASGHALGFGQLASEQRYVALPQAQCAQGTVLHCVSKGVSRDCACVAESRLEDQYERILMRSRTNGPRRRPGGH